MLAPAVVLAIYVAGYGIVRATGGITLSIRRTTGGYLTTISTGSPWNWLYAPCIRAERRLRVAFMD